MKLNNQEAWAVGFLEGEGHFGADRVSSGYWRPKIVAGQKDPEVLLRLKDLYGGWLWCVKRRQPARRREEYYTWAVSGAVALRLMRHLRPSLSRRRQAQIARVLAKDLQALGGSREHRHRLSVGVSRAKRRRPICD